MRLTREQKIKNLLNKISKENFYQEYIIENLDKQYLVDKYDLNTFEWTYFVRDCGMKKPYTLSRKKTAARAKRTHSTYANSCSSFVKSHKKEIQNMMNNGLPISDIFEYYQKKFDFKWHDCSSFRVLVHKEGLTYSSESLEKVRLRRNIRASESLKNRDKEAKLLTLQKYRNTLANLPPEFIADYRKRIQLTKSKWTEERKNLRVQRMVETKRKNKSFSTSSNEENLYQNLIKKFGEIDVERQYIDDRYPYACDFYIRSIDTFIELNLFPSHYKEPFNPDNAEHQRILEELKINPKNWLDTKIIEVWSIRDYNKICKAREENLNYLAIYNNYELRLNTDLVIEKSDIFE